MKAMKHFLFFGPRQLSAAVKQPANCEHPGKRASQQVRQSELQRTTTKTLEMGI